MSSEWEGCNTTTERKVIICFGNDLRFNIGLCESYTKRVWSKREQVVAISIIFDRFDMKFKWFSIFIRNVSSIEPTRIITTQSNKLLGERMK